jgi:hypothetical protein
MPLTPRVGKVATFRVRWPGREFGHLGNLSKKRERQKTLIINTLVSVSYQIPNSKVAKVANFPPWPPLNHFHLATCPDA